MKQFYLILAVALCLTSAAAFAQNSSAKGTIDNNAPKASAGTTPATLHYVYTNHRLVNCMGNQWKDQPENAKLPNGSIVTLKGEVASHHWTKIVKLKDGECVDMNGVIMDHKKAHSETASK